MTSLLLPKQLDQSLQKVFGNKTSVQEKVATAIRLAGAWRVSLALRDAQNLKALTKIGTVYKRSFKAGYFLRTLS